MTRASDWDAVTLAMAWGVDWISLSRWPVLHSLKKCSVKRVRWLENGHVPVVEATQCLLVKLEGARHAVRVSMDERSGWLLVTCDGDRAVLVLAADLREVLVRVAATGSRERSRQLVATRPGIAAVCRWVNQAAKRAWRRVTTAQRPSSRRTH